MFELRVDTDLQKALPSAIDFNFEELKSELAERLDHYNTLVVTEDAIKEAKADRAKLNKLRTAIDTRRKDIKKEYLKPYSEFEGKIKELTVLIDQPIMAIDTQLNEYEERRKEAKLDSIKEKYADIVSDMVKDIIPLERIMDQKWLNSTTSMKKVEEDLVNWEKRVNADLLAMDIVEEEYQAAVREEYIATLDITCALEHRDRLKAAQEAFMAREEAKKAKEAEQAALKEKVPEKATEEIKKDDGVRPETTEPQLYALRLEFRVTREQAVALRNFIDQNSIQYRKI